MRGQVQGVGFRPFVLRVAREVSADNDGRVTGRVWNDAHGVVVELQGTPAAVGRFEAIFRRSLPPLARIDAWARSPADIVAGETDFSIGASDPRGPQHPGAAPTGAVTIDSATCPECVAELLSATDRRAGHALINCTNCGPRFSIIKDVPYDRPNTTMGAFPLCPACAAEYHDPADRRFHAQPVCCPQCGPRVELVRVIARDGRLRGAATEPVNGDPIVEAARMLLAGKIVAIKGIGGFHLAVRADRDRAVGRLRSLKRRDAKPFALMCRDLAMARRIVRLSEAGAAELASARAPIVLAPRTAEADDWVVTAVAAGTDLLGVMLPYTPVHHLLWRALADAAREGARGHEDRMPPLVMTSGNVSSEPLVTQNADAVERLGGGDGGGGGGPLCDAILWHDREIVRCVDDSVLLDRAAPLLPGEDARGPLPIRRSRGYAPVPWRLPAGAGGAANHPTGICVGGELKNTAAVVRQGEVILSQHFGDLTHPLAYDHFRKAIDDLVRLFHVRVDFVAHDLHPHYMSTVAARELAGRYGARLIGVQHHVAHAAAVRADARIPGPTLAIVCDGTGYGIDGTIWGGEVIFLDRARWKRVGRLRPIRLPGGDAAAHDGRRIALSLLHAACGDEGATHPAAAALVPDAAERAMLTRMIRTGFNSPWTSSTGRLFDGVAALLGVCEKNGHEAQAAMALEAAARAGAAGGDGPPPPAGLSDVRWSAAAGLFELDVLPLVRWLVARRAAGAEVPPLAWQFHRELARGLARLTAAAAEQVGDGSGPPTWTASGGVFCNQILERELAAAGREAGASVRFHAAYPPTDAGLSLGQAEYSLAFLLTADLPDDTR
jgi:hydrogenase maturation protein HypF